MPKPNSKSRQELRSRFVRNAIPTETDFADLIAASLNQADDGVLKLPDQPLGLVRQKPDQPVLRFFADPAAEGSAWQVQLGTGDKPGFGLTGADGKLALFVDGKTGNVGIGTVNPGNKLTVQGNFNESKDPESGIMNGGLLALKGNAPQIDFIDTEHGDWSIHVNEGRMYFIREPWEHQDLVLDGKGNIGIGSSVPEAKLNIREITGTLASATKGTLMLDHEDNGGAGASSIVFRSKVNRGSDYAFIEFRDKNPLINDGEAALLTIGMQNDINDHIALMPSGNVGIGTTTPGCKLDVNGDASINGSLRMGAGCEIFFPKYGQIRSLDDNHRILFRIDESKMELREYGDIVFSSGSTQGQETSKMVIHGSGNVGIGIGAKRPEAALHVSGNFKVEAGSITLDRDQKVFFTDNGQIGSRDQYHRLLFRSEESILELREWGSIWLTAGNETCNNKPQMVVSQAEVKIGARLRISENIGTAANEVYGSLLLDHADSGGASSIVFRSKVDQGSDYSFIEYKDNNPATQGVGASLLTIGNQNDINDHIALMPSGNVGIGTTTPGFKLDVNGAVRLGGFTSEEKNEWPNIVWCRDLNKGWDEGLMKRGKSDGFFNRAGFGIHIHESRSFELISTGFRPLLGVEGGTGNTSIRGNLKVNGCITPSAGNSESTGILFPKDPGGGTGDAAWIRYYARSAESCTLEIGIANDNDDQLYLNATGGVRCSGNLTQLSDINVKTNISQLPNPLESLLKLNGISYAWKRSLSDEPTCLGLIAQEVAEVFPQLVESDHDGFLHLNYLGFIPILIESIKAQQKQLLQIQAALQ